jgi:hypothetical protein
MAHVEVMMRGALEPFTVDGSFERLTYEINSQMNQGKQLIAVATPDGRAIAINVNNINTITAPGLEDVFFAS